MAFYAPSLITPDTPFSLVANDRFKPVHYREPPLLPLENEEGRRSRRTAYAIFEHYYSRTGRQATPRRFGIRGQNSPFVLAAVYVTYFWTGFVRPREHTSPLQLHPDSGGRQLALYVKTQTLASGRYPPLNHLSVSLGQVRTVPRKILFEIQGCLCVRGF